MDIAKVYPVYDTPEDVPEDVMLIIYDGSVIIFLSCFMNLLSMLQVKANKRYAGASNWTVKFSCNCNVPCTHQAASMPCYELFLIQCLIPMCLKSGRKLLKTVKNDFGSIDILVHSQANGPEVNLPSKSLYVLFHCHHLEHLIDLFFYHHKGNKTTAGDIKERIPCCNFSI